MPGNEYRIPLEETQSITAPLFDRGVFSAGNLAERAGYNQNTFWTWFIKRGPTPEAAERAADATIQMAYEMLSIGLALKKKALEHKGREPEPRPSPSEVRRERQAVGGVVEISVEELERLRSAAGSRDREPSPSLRVG